MAWTEEGFAPHAVLTDNLARLAERQSALQEMRVCTLGELAQAAAAAADELFAGGMGVYEVLTYLSAGLTPPPPSPHRNALPENLPRLARYLASLCAWDRALFADLFAGECHRRGRPLTEPDFLPGGERPPVIAYVRNAFSDEAYDVFSQDFADPRVRYAQTFAAAVKLLADGEAGYCLLPLEERGGARLPTVSELLFRNDLKIDGVTPVFGFDGTADIKYALVSRFFTVPPVRAEDDRYLEIRLRAEGTDLPALLTAAESFGMSVYRIGTVLLDTEGERGNWYSLVLRDEGQDFTRLLIYLTLFCPDYTAVGIYKNLE